MLEVAEAYGAYDLARDALLLVGGALSAYILTAINTRAEDAKRNRATADAIRAETERIRGLLPPTDPMAAANAPQPPTVHPWMAQVIINSAAISGAIVSQFMGLQHSLEEMTAAQRLLRTKMPEEQLLASLSDDPRNAAKKAELAKLVAQRPALYLEARSLAIGALDAIDLEIKATLAGKP